MLTIYGALAAILRARMTADAGPVTLLSCDNLRSNGKPFHKGFTEFLYRHGDETLLSWLDFARNVCPILEEDGLIETIEIRCYRE